MMTRRFFAFCCNVDKVAFRRSRRGVHAHLSDRQTLYMWTFTHGQCLTPREFSKEWNKLLTYLRRFMPKWCGVRVFELHPGQWNEFSHGMHCHVVTNRRFDITFVLKACRLSGWGRVDVQEIQHANRHYIAKYLNKKRASILKGMRLCQCINLPDFTRLKDIVINSLRGRSFRTAMRRDWGDGRTWIQRGWLEKLALVFRVEFEAIEHGYEWDENAQMLVPPATERKSFVPPPPQKMETGDLLAGLAMGGQWA